MDVQGIYVDKLDPNFYDFFLSGSAPLGASMKNSEYFVSDWTSDSHLTHYLTGKTMDFCCIQLLKCSYTLYVVSYPTENYKQ